MQQTQYLVVTAIGDDRTGIISDLTGLVSECGCNILDSRMAIFGKEFTFIMLLAGDRMAISRIENSLPETSHELGLLTMMKRTSRHKTLIDTQTYNIEYIGIDAPGTLNQVTAFLAEKQVDISSLRADTFEDQQSKEVKHKTSLTIQMAIQADMASFSEGFGKLCQNLEQTFSITPAFVAHD